MGIWGLGDYRLWWADGTQFIGDLLGDSGLGTETVII